MKRAESRSSGEAPVRGVSGVGEEARRGRTVVDEPLGELHVSLLDGDVEERFSLVESPLLWRRRGRLGLWRRRSCFGLRRRSSFGDAVRLKRRSAARPGQRSVGRLGWRSSFKSAVRRSTVRRSAVSRRSVRRRRRRRCALALHLLVLLRLVRSRLAVDLRTRRRPSLDVLLLRPLPTLVLLILLILLPRQQETWQALHVRRTDVVLPYALLDRIRLARPRSSEDGRPRRLRLLHPVRRPSRRSRLLLRRLLLLVRELGIPTRGASFHL